MSIELRHFRCFLAIAETGGITRAAEQLRLTQPAVSRTLRALEQELGVLLVDRSTHHLALTDHGHAFRDRAALAVAAFDDALDPRRLTTWPLRLGHAWAAAGAYTTPLLRRWQRTYPSTPLELLRIDDRTAGLTSGKVDAAVLRGDIRTPGLVTELLTTERRVAALPTDDPLASRPTLTLADLTSRTIALNTLSGITTLDLWPPGIRPTTTLPITNTDDWLATIAAARAIGITSTATPEVHPHPGVTYVPLTDGPPVPVHLARRPGPGHPSLPNLTTLLHEVIGPAAD